nr:UPF0505 protein C16orf62 homolog isoform X1 [Salvelinus alpinus]
MIHASIILISSFSQKREVNTVLSDIIKHIMPDHAFEDAYAQFQSVIRKTLTYFHDFSILFSMERFLPFVDMFQKDSVRVKVCLSIMDVFINALTLEDEKRSLALLINGFIRMAVNQLAMETSCVMRGSHSHKTAALVRSVPRQGSLAFSLFGCLLAHGELCNNKLNLWNLSHTRTSVSKTQAVLGARTKLGEIFTISTYTTQNMVYFLVALFFLTGEDTRIHQAPGPAARHGSTPHPAV